MIIIIIIVLIILIWVNWKLQRLLRLLLGAYERQSHEEVSNHRRAPQCLKITFWIFTIGIRVKAKPVAGEVPLLVVLHRITAFDISELLCIVNEYVIFMTQKPWSCISWVILGYSNRIVSLGIIWLQRISSSSSFLVIWISLLSDTMASNPNNSIAINTIHILTIINCYTANTSFCRMDVIM